MNPKRKNSVDSIRLATVKCTCGNYYLVVDGNTFCPKCGSIDGTYTIPQDKKLIESMIEQYIKILETKIAAAQREIAILKDKTDYPEAFIRPHDGVVFVLNKNNKYVVFPRTNDTDKYEYSHEAIVASHFYPIRKEMLEVR